MNTFSYIEKRLIELGQERKARLEHASSDEEKSVINSFYSGAKNELELLRDELMNHVPPVDDELPENHIILELCYEKLNSHIKTFETKHTNGYECLIQALPLSFIREFHDFLIEKGEIILDNNSGLDVENTSSELPLAIMTFIACGEEFGAKLEVAFPEYKGANPKYSLSH